MKKDGGPAFPCYDCLGMSLRDWFAGQALCALLANDDVGNMRTFEHYANNAYSFADAMLKEREK